MLVFRLPQFTLDTILDVGIAVQSNILYQIQCQNEVPIQSMKFETRMDIKEKLQPGSGCQAFELRVIFFTWCVGEVGGGEGEGNEKTVVGQYDNSVSEHYISVNLGD